MEGWPKIHKDSLLSNGWLIAHNNLQISTAWFKSTLYSEVPFPERVVPPPTAQTPLSGAPYQSLYRAAQTDGWFTGCKWQFTEQISPTNMFCLAHTVFGFCCLFFKVGPTCKIQEISQINQAFNFEITKDLATLDPIPYGKYWLPLSGGCHP